MKGEARRQAILDRLTQTQAPVSAATLAGEFGVSRQVIVQDIALLRAAGNDIQALSRGYRLMGAAALRRVFKVVHGDEDVARELNAIVDLGGIVEDVFVSHRTYGTIRAPMGIRSRMDVTRFLDQLSQGKSSLLKNVTANYHYHTVQADSQEILDLIEDRLWQEGFLAPLQDFEPVDFAAQH